MAAKAGSHARMRSDSFSSLSCPRAPSSCSVAGLSDLQSMVGAASAPSTGPGAGATGTVKGGGQHVARCCSCRPGQKSQGQGPVQTARERPGAAGTLLARCGRGGGPTLRDELQHAQVGQGRQLQHIARRQAPVARAAQLRQAPARRRHHRLHQAAGGAAGCTRLLAVIRRLAHAHVAVAVGGAVVVVGVGGRRQQGAGGQLQRLQARAGGQHLLQAGRRRGRHAEGQALHPPQRRALLLQQPAQGWAVQGGSAAAACRAAGGGGARPQRQISQLGQLQRQLACTAGDRVGAVGGSGWRRVGGLPHRRLHGAQSADAMQKSAGDFCAPPGSRTSQAGLLAPGALSGSLSRRCRPRAAGRPPV